MVVSACLLPFWLKSNNCSWVAHVFQILSPESSSPEFCATFYVVSFACFACIASHIASFVTMPRICLWVSSAISTMNSAQAQTLSQTFDLLFVVSVIVYLVALAAALSHSMHSQRKLYGHGMMCMHVMWRSLMGLHRQHLRCWWQ